MNMRWMKSSLTLLLFLPFLGSCAVGYNTTLFMTKSNIGLDVETKPPTAEISIARREGVIAPGFEGGQTPPVISSFQHRSNVFSRFFFGVQSTFAGGDAAVALAQGPGGRRTGHESGLCLSQKPVQQKFLWRDVSIPEKGEVYPFFFATDTTFGLKAAWSGTTGQFPDTLRLGFHRKEFAWAPLFGTDVAQCKIPGTAQDGSYVVWMPSFLAVLDNDVQVGQPSETGVKWLQYFATGTSATTWANHDEVRHVMMNRIDPLVHTATWDPTDQSVVCIDNWLSQDEAHVRELTDWWAQQGLGGNAALLIKGSEYAKERKKFIDEKRIPCT
jgi:hypothetical protein